jgi:malonyl CoA-acyl carrier protein transacylase
MIGHTKCAAGLAGLINASLALHHKVMPPTIGVETINPKADLLDGPFHVSNRKRPWIHPGDGTPRRAGVSAFGFGGTNFHAVLEAYEGNFEPTAPTRDWPAELFAWRAGDRPKLLEQIETLAKSLEAGARPALRDLARAVNAANPPMDGPLPTLAIVANSLEDLIEKLKSARSAIASGQARIEDRRGLFYEELPRYHGQPVAFLFPGQGSQSPGMLADLTMAFPEVRQAFDDFDAALNQDGRPTIGSLVYPTDLDASPSTLISTDMAQPAIGAASVGLLRLLRSLGVEGDVFAGHSFGELVALHASRSLSLEGLATLAHERGRLMLGSLGEDPGTMAAISAGPDEVGRLIEGLESVAAVNENGPRQTVIAGSVTGVEQAVEIAKQAGFRAQLLPVAGAFHTAKVARAVEPLTIAAASRLVSKPERPVYSNLDGLIHPPDPEQIADRLGKHVARPVRFASMVEAMHRDGARVFVEVGPGSVLTPLVGSILEGRTHLAVACDSAGRLGLPTLLQTLARLIVGGVPVRLDRMSAGRSNRVLDLAALPVGDGLPPATSTTWLVNGSRVRPIGQVEPRRLGQGPALPVPKVENSVNQTPYRNGSTNGHHPHANGNSSHAKATMTPIPAPPKSTPLNPPAPSSQADDRVLASFQETMRAFLEVQRSTMLAYLAGRSAPPSMVPVAVPTPTPSTIPDARAGRISSRPAPIKPEPSPIVEPTPIAVAPAPAAEEPIGRERVARKLVEIVRDRTGYPTEMLGLDLDLEADLGIDSIKRVEILGTLRDVVPWPNGASNSSTMDALSRARTLGAIVDRVVEIAGRNASSARVESLAPAPTAPTSQVRRMVLEAVPSPLSSDREGLVTGGVVVVTDDGRGVARAVAAELESAGHSVVLAGLDEVDFASPSSVEGLLDLARSSGAITALIHALPLREVASAGLDPIAWANRIGPEVKGLFLLAKGAADDLERASKRGGGALIAATSMGGKFATGSGTSDFFPGHGGVAGLVKTLAREWPGVRTRVVDFDPKQPSSLLASRLVDEVKADDDWSEVGYANDRRIRLQAKLAPLISGSTSKIDMKPGEPLIVTGGARGITATVAAELARQWKPTLLLLGRSPLPEGSEDLETASITSATELKAALHARLRRQGRPITPGELERAFQAIGQAREIRSNLDMLRSCGATVEYAAVNVRDAEALGKVLEGWRRRFGEPVGLIHGAGVIKDKLIRDKTPELFDHVLGTKLDGALNLARLLKPETIRFAALFSSIAGRFGNLGQADYAAANDVLNKLAIWLNRRWPGRVVAMNWGPWSGVGMVSELEGHLGGRGLGMIPPEIGRSLLMNELRMGKKGDVEVIAAGDLGTLDGPIERLKLAEAVR